MSRLPLAVAIPGLALAGGFFAGQAWESRRMNAFEQQLHLVSAQQAALLTQAQRPAPETCPRVPGAGAGADKAELAALREQVVRAVREELKTKPAAAEEAAPERTAENDEALARATAVVQSALAAHGWSDTNAQKLQLELPRLAPADRLELMHQIVVATNEGRLELSRTPLF